MAAPPHTLKEVSTLIALLHGKTYKQAQDWTQARRLYDRQGLATLLALDWDAAFTPKRYEIFQTSF